MSSKLHSIVTECLVSDEFLSKIQKDKIKTVSILNLDSNERKAVNDIDWDKIELLSAFITKVQNNHLLGFLPNTMEMLSILNISLDVFSAYKLTHQKMRKIKRLTINDKTLQFSQHLNEYIQQNKGINYDILYDLFVHEILMWQLTNDKLFYQVITEPYWDNQISLNGRLCSRTYKFNPLKVINKLHHSYFDITKIKPSPTSYLYWKLNKSSSIELIEVDEITTSVVDELFVSPTINRNEKELAQYIESSNITVKEIFWNVINNLISDNIVSLKTIR